MKKETIDQLIQFLTAMAHHSREYALKLKAFELVAKKHPEIFRAYEELSLTKTLCTLIRMSFSQANREAQAVRGPA
jgi:hypothetical protein